MTTHNKLGKKLKEARLNSGFTQEKVSEILNISRQKLGQVEKGQGPLDTIIMKKLADLYGYSMSYFFETAPIEKTEDVQLAFRSFSLEKEDQEIINWARKVLFNINDLDEIMERNNMT